MLNSKNILNSLGNKLKLRSSIVLSDLSRVKCFSAILTHLLIIKNETSMSIKWSLIPWKDSFLSSTKNILSPKLTLDVKIYTEDTLYFKFY